MLLQDFVNKFLKKNVSDGILKKIDKKFLPHFLPQILAIKGVGGVELGESVKKRKFATEIFFRKLWKMIYTNIKADVKQEIKELVAIYYNFSQKYLLKIEIQYKAGFYFSFNLGWHSIQFDPLSVTKDICRRSLSGWLLSLEFKVYLEKFIPSPVIKEFHVIPGYNMRWYTDQPS